MRNRALLGLMALCAWIAVTQTPAQTATADTSDQPSDVGLVEETGRALVQLDVSVWGPEEMVALLTAEDFELTVGGRPVESFFLDRACSGRAAPERLVEGRRVAPDPTVTPTPIVGVSYLFYFDQHHLTMLGRGRSLELARELARQLVVAPNRAMVVSAGRDVKTFADWTSDPMTLLQAIDELEQDALQRDEFPMQEDFRVAHVQKVLEDGLDDAAAKVFQDRLEMARNKRAPVSVRQLQKMNEGPMEQIEMFRDQGLASAENVAWEYRQEEKWRTEQALTRFSVVG